MTPYATRLRIHLAESRRAGLPWEEAWRKALLQLTPETDFPLCGNPMCRVQSHDCSQTKNHWRDGYLRVGKPIRFTPELLDDHDDGSTFAERLRRKAAA